MKYFKNTTFFGFNKLKMDKLDFKTFDERFQNIPVTIGDEQSEIDNKRDAFIAENALTYKPVPAVPTHIKGELILIFFGIFEGF